MAELASSLATHWPELLLGLIILYALIALLLTVLVFIGGRLQARTKTAIERLTAEIADLAERSATASAGAGDAEIITAIERLNAKIDQSRPERPTAQPENHAAIGAELRTAIERLTEKTEQLAAPRAVEVSEDASHHYALDEIKAAIDALTIEVQQLTAGIQNIQKPTAELERWRGEMQRELRDLLKELQ